MAGKMNWAVFDLENLPTVDNVIEHGTFYYQGTGGNSGTYTYYVLADKPVKYMWYRAGYNVNPIFCSEEEGANIYLAHTGMDRSARASVISTTYTHPDDRYWVYAGIDGYWSTVHYDLPFSGVGSYPDDWTAPDSDYTITVGEQTNYVDRDFVRSCNDGDWDWAPVTLGTVVDPEPEPTTEFSVNVTITCVPESTGDNPYEPGGDAEPGGGGGTYDNVSDVIPRPPLPEIGIADGTFMAMFNPSQSELKDLADALFDTTIWTEAYRQIFGSPIDYIVSLTIAPLQPPITDEPVEFSLGASPFANISMYQITQQYVEVNCGTITIPEYWKAFLDYEPYSSIQIFLPYVGYRDLSPSEVLNKPLNVRYYIDLLTGACIAFVESDGTTLYQFDGNCLAQLPITAIQHTQIMSGMISALGFGATALATKGLGMFGKAGDFMLWGSGASAASSVVNAAKPTVTHGGNLTANQGFLGIQKPYCILRRPRQAIASEQNAFAGYATWYRSPNFMFTQGFTKVAEIHLENVPATEWEIREIERLLKEGVIF